jgi:hypothetical protein
MVFGCSLSYLVKSSSLKEALGWLIGYSSELPYIDRAKNQIRRRIAIEWRLEFFSLVTVYLMYFFEKLSREMESAPLYTYTKFNATAEALGGEEVVEWEYNATKCAVTCVGWREDWGIAPSEVDAYLGRPKITLTSAANCLLAVLLFRYIFTALEQHFVIRIYNQFQDLADTLAEAQEKADDKQIEVRKVSAGLLRSPPSRRPQGRLAPPPPHNPLSKLPEPIPTSEPILYPPPS